MANFSSNSSDCIERTISISHNDPSVTDSIDIFVDYEITQVCDWINKNEYQKVCLQFPDSLLSYSDKVYEEIKSRVCADIYILADTTYSSCCVDEVTAMHVQADAIVHYGHSCLSTCSVPVYICLPKHRVDVDSLQQILQDFCVISDAFKFCLFYDAAYDYLKDEISQMWFKVNPKGFIANVDKSKHEDGILGRLVIDSEGGVLKFDEISGLICIYVGPQSPTMFNCVISTNAKWVLLDPKSLQVQSLDESAWFKRRRYLIEKCKDAISIGILVCKLSGPTTMEIVKRMKELCRNNHKKSYILSVGKPNVAKLANFPEIDIYVLIACPENDLYSSRDFYKPLVYPYELEVALNNMPYFQDQHVTDYEHLLKDKREFRKYNEQEVNADVSLISGKIRGFKINHSDSQDRSLEKTQWAIQEIGANLSDRTWSGLEQKLGETSVKAVEIGRSGLPITYENEPKDI